LPGVLFVIGTPIGNLGDITRRAVDTLATVDRVVAEDTRRTRALLSHLGITGKPLECIDANAPLSRMQKVVELLSQGQRVALVTDAGMPGISDPGARLVTAATAAGVEIQVVPGPSSVTAALALSGLVEGPFYFLGFLPRQGKRRRAALDRVTHSSDPVVLFESPQRIGVTLRELSQLQPERSAVVCRELTKLHEEVRRGTLSALSRDPGEPRGEFVIVLGAFDAGESEDDKTTIADDALLDRLRSGNSPRTVLEDLQLSGQQRRETYARLLALAETIDASDGEDP
jgi:16S rRNA (cytidine1402-2'-O)-methyltransferase